MKNTLILSQLKLIRVSFNSSLTLKSVPTSFIFQTMFFFLLYFDFPLYRSKVESISISEKDEKNYVIVNEFLILELVFDSCFSSIKINLHYASVMKKKTTNIIYQKDFKKNCLSQFNHMFN